MNLDSITLNIEYVDVGADISYKLTITDLPEKTEVEYLIEAFYLNSRIQVFIKEDSANQILKKLLNVGVEEVSGYKAERICDGEIFRLEVFHNNEQVKKLVLIHPNYSKDQKVIQIANLLRKILLLDIECFPKALSENKLKSRLEKLACVEE